MRTHIVAAAVTAVIITAVSATTAAAQDAAREQARVQEKLARVAAIGQQPMTRQLLPPGGSTARQPYFRVEIHQGGVYEPSIYPGESWLEIACIHDDLQTQYNRAEYGSGLFKVHAIVYDADLDEIHNTIDTTASDEAICSVSFTVDSSFIELSRADGRRAAAVALIAVPSARQYIEASKLVYRVLPE